VSGAKLENMANENPSLWTKEKKTVFFFNYLNIVSQPHNFSAFGAGNNLYC